MSDVVSYTGPMRKGNHDSPEAEEHNMGNDGRVMTKGIGVAMAGNWNAREELRLLARRSGVSGTEQQAQAALERYLQIPTFRRQGRRLSCR